MPSTGAEKRQPGWIGRLVPPLNNVKKFTCVNPESNISDFPALKDRLPDGYEYHVCEYKTIRETGDHLNFRATVRMALSKEDQIKLWLKSHAVKWRVARTDPGKGQKVLFKVDYRCQHNIRPKCKAKVAGRGKNTNCPARISVTLVRTHVSRGRQSRSTDPHLPAFPTIVRIRSDHNHNVNAAGVVISVSGDCVPHQFLWPQREEVVLSTGTDAAEHWDVADDTWEDSDDSDLLMEAEEVEQAASVEGSHQAAAARFAQMCQELTAMVNSSPSFTTSAVAAVKAFEEIRDSPSEVITALRTFGRYADTGHGGPAIPAQPTGAARHGMHWGARRGLAAGHPTVVTTGPDHIYSQSAERV